jgi:adenine-specific DNA-methyltransferase
MPKQLTSATPDQTTASPRNYLRTGRSRGRRTSGTDQEQLTAETLAWRAATPLAQRKALGQYMTPRDLRERLLDLVPIQPGDRILDPGVGTGEFLGSVAARVPGAHLFGWDIDPAVVAPITTLVPSAEITIRSALDPYAGPQFDVVIGNPPYFQFAADPALRARFAGVISGRPNIFALFFQASLEVLKDDGYLGFVVPTSMNNGAYFEALRRYILAAGALEQLEPVVDHFAFSEAQAPVQLLVVRKGAASEHHLFRRAVPEAGLRRTIFSAAPERLAAEFAGRLTLWEAGYEAVTGTVVWNQAREHLTGTPDPARQTVPLIWADQITTSGTISVGRRSATKPGHVAGVTPLDGPAIVVNRIVGAVGGGRLRAALVPAGPFVGENHVNVIRARQDVRQLVDWDTLLTALIGPGIGKRIQLLTGNTQLSATELTHLLPLEI